MGTGIKEWQLKEKKNYMDYVPCCNPRYTWDTDQEGIVTVHVLNQGFYNRLAQKLFGKPSVSHIRLDGYGSFVWKQMNGMRTVYEIAGLVKDRFGEEAEPVIGRLVKYFQILYQNKLIGYAILDK